MSVQEKNVYKITISETTQWRETKQTDRFGLPITDILITHFYF